LKEKKKRFIWGIVLEERKNCRFDNSRIQNLASKNDLGTNSRKLPEMGDVSIELEKRKKGDAQQQKSNTLEVRP